MKRNLIFLAVLTVLALAAVLVFAPRDTTTGDSTADALLLPQLADVINDVERVDIVTAGDTTAVTLNKTAGQWQIEQMGGYRADWSKLRELLAGLAQARVVEVKTDKPEYYARLGVEDVASEDADSVLIRLSNGGQTTAVIIGHEATGRKGQYVRLQDSAASALVDRTLDVPIEQLDWADKRIIDINASEVAEVEIIHPGGDRVLVTKVSADQTDFELVDLPTDREIQSSWAVNSLGSTLSLLDLETARPADSIDWQTAVRMRLLSFSGLEIMAEMVEADGEYLVRLNAGHPAAKVANAGDEEVARAAAEDVANRVKDINQRVNGWAYGIAKYKFEAMVKTREDILKPVDEDGS